MSDDDTFLAHPGEVPEAPSWRGGADKLTQSAVQRALDEVWSGPPNRGWNWSRCSNYPPCGHADVFHDVEDLDDDSPRCCIEGCDCGSRPP